jgi:hypothetical protein
MQHCSDGIDSIKSGINELIKYKYISYKKTKADVETYIFKAYNLILNINIIL